MKRCTCTTCGRRYAPVVTRSRWRQGGRWVIKTNKPKCIGWCESCLDDMIRKIMDS